MSDIKIEELLTKDELYTINFTLCDVLVNNPINAKRIISVLKLAGEASNYGLNPAEIIEKDLKNREHYTSQKRNIPFPPHETCIHFDKCSNNPVLPFRKDCEDSENYCNWKGFEKGESFEKNNSC